MDELAILDFETASFNASDGPVEVAYITVDDDLNVLTETQSLIKPYGKISAGAAGVHGITLDMVADKPTFKEFMAEQGHPFVGKRVLVIGHNVAFDMKFAEGEFGAEMLPLCTLRLARRIYPEAENHKLATLMFELGLKKKGRHNALDDVYTCHELLLHMRQTTGLSLEGLFDLHGEPLPIKKIGFGKHKGSLLADLPSEYVSWLLGPKGPDNLDADLRLALKAL